MMVQPSWIKQRDDDVIVPGNRYAVLVQFRSALPVSDRRSQAVWIAETLVSRLALFRWDGEIDVIPWDYLDYLGYDLSAIYFTAHSAPEGANLLAGQVREEADRICSELFGVDRQAAAVYLAPRAITSNGGNGNGEDGTSSSRAALGLLTLGAGAAIAWFLGRE